MSTSKRIVLLNGSPKGNGGGSGKVADYLLSHFTGNDYEGKVVQVNKWLRSTEGGADLFREIDDALIVILVFPLYVDCIPAGLLKTMELIYAHRTANGRSGSPRLAVYIHSGFPEAEQCDTAVDICRIFARDAGFEWAGALKNSSGGMVSDMELSPKGPLAVVVKALDMAARDLLQGNDIGEEANALVRRPRIPLWLYKFVGGWGFNRVAKKNGVRDKIMARPYERK